MYFTENIALNIISFYKSNEVIAKATSAIFYNNWHAFVNYSIDIIYFRKLFVESEVFPNKPKKGLDIKKFKDLYAFGPTTIVSSVIINPRLQTTIITLWGPKILP